MFDREDYITEAEKQLIYKTVYKNINFNSKILQKRAETSNEIFKNSKRKVKKAEKELN